MARDLFHEHIKQILIADGWTITQDPYSVKSENKVQYQIDLGAEKVIAAEKGTEKIAIEVKSFLNESKISDFHTAVGQYLNYKIGLLEVEKDRVLYLALPDEAYNYLWELPLVRRSIETYDIKLLVYQMSEINVLLWRK